MALSYFNETFVFDKRYILNNFRMKRFKDKLLLTTDHGAWIVLDQKEYDSMIRYELSDPLFKLLEDKGIILTMNNVNNVLHDYDHRLSFLKQGPSLHIITPTLRCNLRCSYCHSSSKSIDEKGFDMDEETMRKTVDFIFQSSSPVITIELQGGEPLLRKDLLKKIIEYAKEKNKVFKKDLRFSFATNSLLFDDDTIEFIRENKVRVSVSIDGPESLHDKHRKTMSGQGTYRKTIDMIKNLKTKGIDVGCLLVTTRDSLEQYKEIIDEYVGLGMEMIQLKNLSKLGYADEDWDRISMNEGDFIDYWKKSVDYIIQVNKSKKLRERNAYYILNKILSVYDAGNLDMRAPCGMLIGQIAYDHNGNIFSCDEGRCYDHFNMGNVKTDSYKEVMMKIASRTLISSSMTENYLCDGCVYKPYCGICPVVSYAEQNNVLPILPLHSRCVINKIMFDTVFEKLIFDKEAKDIFVNWFNNDKLQRESINKLNESSKEFSYTTFCNKIRKLVLQNIN